MLDFEVRELQQARRDAEKFISAFPVDQRDGVLAQNPELARILTTPIPRRRDMRMPTLEDALDEYDATRGLSTVRRGPGRPPGANGAKKAAVPVPKSKLIWEEPPETSRNRKPPEWLPELKANPGRWARVGSSKSASAAMSLRKRHGLETAARRAPSGGFVIYARWPG